MKSVISNVNNVKKFVSLLERIVVILKNEGYDIVILKHYQPVHQPVHPVGCIITDDSYFCLSHKKIDHVTLLRLLNRACVFNDVTLEMKEIFTNLLLESESEFVGFSYDGRIYNTFWPFTNILNKP